MEIRQLKYFLAVADARSFVNAANTLFISRQAVSKAIAQLESELNVELFMRGSNGAFLTPAGVMFYDRVRSSVMELDQLRTEMQAYGKRYHQRVRLAFSVGLLPLYEESLLQFSESNKNLDVEYDECSDQECMRRLLERDVDLAISGMYPEDSAVHCWCLTESPYGLLSRETDALWNEDPGRPFACMADVQTLDFCAKHRKTPRFTGYDRYRLFALTEAGRCDLLLPKVLAPRDRPNLHWTSLDAKDNWRIVCSFLHSLEKNVLYHTVINELFVQVFGQIPELIEANRHD